MRKNPILVGQAIPMCQCGRPAFVGDGYSCLACSLVWRQWVIAHRAASQAGQMIQIIGG